MSGNVDDHGYGDLEPFGYKQWWVAVRDRTQEEVAATLALTGGRVGSFEEGVNPPEERGTDIALFPALPGVGGDWVLVLRYETVRGAPMTVDTLVALSRELNTEAHLYATHRVVEFHEWARATAGELRRHFSVAGERGELQQYFGAPTPVEIDLGLPDASSLDEVGDEDARFQVVLDVDESTLMDVAGAWSVDPSSLSGPSPGPTYIYPGRTAPRAVPSQAPAPSGAPQAPRRSGWRRWLSW